MKRNRIIALALSLAMLVMIAIIVKDILSSEYANNTSNVDKTEEKGLIAIIDSGANLGYVNYNESIKISKYNVLDGSTNITDTSKRGTMIFSALYNNEFSMHKENDVLIIKAFEKSSQIDPNNIAKAINYACEQDADIINISFDIAENDSVTEAIKACKHKGTTIVAMDNSNSTTDDLSYPANLEEVVSVSMVDSTAKTDVKVDIKDQKVCLASKCYVNNHIALSTAYVTGYLVDYKDMDKAAENLVLQPSYGVSVVE